MTRSHWVYITIKGLFLYCDINFFRSYRYNNFLIYCEINGFSDYFKFHIVLQTTIRILPDMFLSESNQQIRYIWSKQCINTYLFQRHLFYCCRRGVHLVNLCNSAYLKAYCTVFQHALKSLEITGIVSSQGMSKTARKNSKGLNVIRNWNFN